MSENTFEQQLYRSLGANICRARRAAGFTQQELAARLGLTRTSVVNIEKGNQRVLVHTLVSIAGTLKILPRTLLATSDCRDAPLADLASQELPAQARAWIDGAVATRSASRI